MPLLIATILDSLIYDSGTAKLKPIYGSANASVLVLFFQYFWRVCWGHCILRSSTIGFLAFDSFESHLSFKSVLTIVQTRPSHSWPLLIIKLWSTVLKVQLKKHSWIFFTNLDHFKRKYGYTTSRLAVLYLSIRNSFNIGKSTLSVKDGSPATLLPPSARVVQINRTGRWNHDVMTPSPSLPMKWGGSP